MRTSEGSEVATPPSPQGRQLPRRRRRYAVARTATNRRRAGKEALTAVITKAYRPEECARSTSYRVATFDFPSVLLGFQRTERRHITALCQNAYNDGVF